jgi:hypothetical protein
MATEHDTAGLGDQLIALARQQMRERFTLTLSTMGVSEQNIQQQTELFDIWQKRLAELTRLGFEPTQLDEMMRSFAEIWFSNDQKSPLPTQAPNSR